MVFAWGIRRAVLTLGVTQTIGYAGSFYLPAILAEPMAKSVGATTPFVFGVFSGALLIQAVLAQVLGRLVDKRGGRLPLAASSLIFGAGLLCLGLAQSPLQLAAAWFVIGVAMALGLYDIAFAGLVGWFGADARRSITGVTLIAGFASTVGWPLTTWLAAHVSWRGACFAWAAAQLLIALPLHLTLPRGPAEQLTPNDGAPSKRPLQPGHSPRVQMVLVAIAFAAMAAVGSAVAAHLPSLLMALGASTAAAVGAGALVGPAQVLARVAEYTFVRRLHPLISARASVSLFPLGAAALLAFGPLMAAPFAILYGCGNGLFTIARGTLPLALFGSQNYGARLGAITIPGRFLQAAAPLGFAVLMQSSARISVAVLAGLCLLGLACLLALRAPHTDASSA